jgi:hypothetical protein
MASLLFSEPLGNRMSNDPASRAINAFCRVIEPCRQLRRELGSYNSSFIAHFDLLVTQVV